MEYSFTVKHIKGSSNYTADSLSRLPVCEEGGLQARYPDGPLKELSQLPINKIQFVCEEDIMLEVKRLACQPQGTMVDITIAQVMGETPKEAWDVLPMERVRSAIAAWK